MKREILCTACGGRIGPGVSADTDPFVLAERYATGEGVKRIKGTLYAGAMCDGCGVGLEKGDRAVAQSIYNNQAPYYEWESDYLARVEETVTLSRGGGVIP